MTDDIKSQRIRDMLEQEQRGADDKVAELLRLRAMARADDTGGASAGVDALERDVPDLADIDRALERFGVDPELYDADSPARL